MTTDPLAPAVRRLFSDLAHAGPLDLPSPERVLQGEAGKAQRGTWVRFLVALQGGRPVTARYQAYGCPHTLATCEWLCRQLEAGRQADIGTPADWCRALGIPIVRMGRLLVVEDAYCAAMHQIGDAAACVRENVVK